MVSRKFYGNNDFRSKLRLSEKARDFLAVSPTFKIEEIARWEWDDETEEASHEGYTYDLYLDGLDHEPVAEGINAEEVNKYIEDLADEAREWEEITI